MADPKARSTADWERVELDYRAGILTLREIAQKHGITHGAINKRAKRDGWTRNLNARIQAQADALVSKAMVSIEVSAARLDTENEAVEAGARAIAEVKLRERHGLKALLSERTEMLKELVAQRDALIPMERVTEILAELEDRPADANELRKVYQRAVGLGGRASILKALAEIDAKLIPLERQAWGMDDAPSKVPELESIADDELDRRIDARLNAG